MTPLVPNDPSFASSVRRLILAAACLVVVPLLAGRATAQVPVPQSPATPRPAAPPAAAPVSKVFPLSVAWTVPLDAPHAVEPAYDRGAMYVSLTSGRLARISLSTGDVQWSADVGEARSVCTAGGLVLVATTGRIQARDVGDGRARWEYPVAGAVSAPLLCLDASLIVATDASRVLALGVRDGALLWQATVSSPVAARPAASGSALYVPLSGRRLARLDLADGRQRWEAPLAAQPDVLLALDDRVYAATSAHTLCALRARDGHVEWRVKRVDVTGQPLADRERVYFLAFDNSLRAVNRGNGSLEWRRPLDHRARAGPIRHDDLLVVAGRSNIAAVTTGRGTEAGSFDAPHDLTAPIHVVPGLVTVDMMIVTITTTGVADQVVAFRPAALDPR